MTWRGSLIRAQSRIDDATRTQGTLRIDPTANGQDKRVRWARDYELPA